MPAADLKKKAETELALVAAFRAIRKAAVDLIRDTEPGTDIGKGLRAVSRMGKAYDAFIKDMQAIVGK